MRLASARRLAIAVALAGTLAAGPEAASSIRASSGHDLAQVRQATARYHRVSSALEDGFVPFSLDPANPDVPTCFDSDAGGMGVHYVRNIDAVLDPADPEALVYELTEHGRQRLVAVEYIVPAEFVDPTDPPQVLGHALHEHSFLPVFVLHAWVWRTNPSGTFADYNPHVGGCP